jgi:hypothetical protein
MSRRFTRRQWVQFAGCCAAGLGALDSFAVEPFWLEVTEHDIAVPGLPHSLQGFRIAHLSDLHLRSIGRVHESVFAAVRALEPSLVVLTGDSIEDENHLGVLEELCRQLVASGRDVIATLGNWEHWGRVSVRRLHETYARAGARLLGNESLVLGNGIVLVATDDSCSGHDDLASALSHVPSGAVRLFSPTRPEYSTIFLPARPVSISVSPVIPMAGRCGRSERPSGFPPVQGGFVPGCMRAARGKST